MDPQQPELEAGGGMCAEIEEERDEQLVLAGQERRTENSTASCVPSCYLLQGRFSESSVPCVYDNQGRLVPTACGRAV